MYKLKNNKITNLLGAVCAGVFALLALMVISPGVANEVEAVTDGTVLPASVDNKQILSVSLDKNNVYFGEVTATEAGQFLTEAVNVKVSSNAEKGFKLYVNTMEATTAMNNTTTAGGEIASLSRVVATDATGTDFPANQWGYNLVDGKDTSSFVYSPINASDHAEATSTNAPSSRDYTLNFATKLDTTLPAGTYRNNMIVSAVTDPVRILTLNDISTMQEMTSEICSNTLAANAASLPAGEKQLVTPGNEPSKQLIDTRDGKQYWVSKLADQNCWMVQNLDLDIPATGLKAVDTDIEADWTNPTAGTIKDNNFNVGTSREVSYSWDVGEWVLKNPTNIDECNNIPTNGNMASCNQLEVWNGTQDAHYLLGNYYQWNTAAAGNDELPKNGEVTPVSVSGSICPKGWQLPVAESKPGTYREPVITAEKSFANLLSKYGWESFPTNGGWGWYATSPNASGQHIELAPLYFTNFGGISVDSDGAFDVSYGDAWSKTTGGYLSFALGIKLKNQLAPVAGDEVKRGNSVRCLAR